MPSAPGGTSRLPGYDLQEPSEADARAALERVFGPERAADRWSRACHAAGLLPGHVLGNLCVVGLEQRSFAEEDLAVLRELAGEAVRRIERRRPA